jgi:hypothetical protein
MLLQRRDDASAETLLAVLCDARTVRPREHEHAVIRDAETEATLMHEPMMKTTQRDEIA